MLSLIVAMDQNRVIGNKGAIPWHLPDDFEYFKALTSGHPVIMGRKTHESIGRTLPKRTNIVITRDTNYLPHPGSFVTRTLEEALNMARKQDGAEEIFIIGGAEIYAMALSMTNRIYLTEIHHAFSGDTFFPDIPKNQWKEISRKKGLRDEKHAFDHDFVIYEKT